MSGHTAPPSSPDPGLVPPPAPAASGAPPNHQHHFFHVASASMTREMLHKVLGDIVGGGGGDAPLSSRGRATHGAPRRGSLQRSWSWGGAGAPGEPRRDYHVPAPPSPRGPPEWSPWGYEAMPRTHGRDAYYARPPPPGRPRSPYPDEYWR